MSLKCPVWSPSRMLISFLPKLVKELAKCVGIKLGTLRGKWKIQIKMINQTLRSIWEYECCGGAWLNHTQRTHTQTRTYIQTDKQTNTHIQSLHWLGMVTFVLRWLFSQPESCSIASHAPRSARPQPGLRHQISSHRHYTNITKNDITQISQRYYTQISHAGNICTIHKYPKKWYHTDIT